jgi:catechol 2,3-dioxygenase
MTTPRDPEEATAIGSQEIGEIAPATRMGPVSLTVADLDGSVVYYESTIGLQTLERSDGRASLGAGGTELLELVELPGATPADRMTGLFHLALLVPSRPDLAAWLAHAARDRVGLTGLSDHYVSEAIYLRDPDHHGIEIYADRPREIWDGLVGMRMTTEPLDTDSLFGELDDPATAPFDGLPAGTVMGHVHLRVADIPSTVDFYRDRLGFGLTAALGGQAACRSAGGYHHHLGANTWESAGAPAPPEGSAALRHFTVFVPDTAERDRVADRAADGGATIERDGDEAWLSDPSGNRLRLVPDRA